MSSSENIILNYFSNYIEKEIGIVYHETSHFQLKRRLEAVIRHFEIENLDQFHQMAQKGLSEKIRHHLLDTATNNETAFFRDPKVFKAIEAEIFPQITKNNSSIDLWSVACSSGQECYSLAFILNQFTQKNCPLLKFSIFASDISQQILDHAQKAEYSKLEINRGLDEHHLKTYFREINPGRWTVTDEIRKKVEFKKLNLLKPFPISRKFDLILCRNVLIYQSKERKEKILNRISEHLKPGGFLVMGSGETLVGIKNNYEQILSEGAIHYRKKEAEAMAFKKVG